jgi:glucose-1-phosphate adenylyltransferase
MKAVGRRSSQGNGKAGARAARPRVLALVLAGGEGNRLGALTKKRAKPSLPFAGSYRLIDFSLSNCVHSHISDVWVIEQFQPHGLNEHLSNGRPYDLDRTHGGLRLMPPHQGGPKSGWHQGNADALYRNSRFIREFDPQVLVVLSSDHIYALDLRDPIEAHLNSGAHVTMVTTRVGGDEIKRFGNVKLGRGGKVSDFAYKPEKPISDIATTEIFVYDPQVLLGTLDELADREERKLKRKKGKSFDPSEVALSDFGHELLPALVEQGGARAFEHEGYWRDVGTVESYYEGNMDFLHGAPEGRPFDLDDPNWSILTRGEVRSPAIFGNAQVANSMISPGCVVRGHVSNSVLSPGVVVKEGAVVEDSIVLHDAVLEKGARVRRAIVDQGQRVSGEVVGGEEPIVVSLPEDEQEER